ncbi:hypothetical protein APA_1349 [Pseudanabaena sp. lw0831]|uniref:eCIS core domain-containing protein n=1 Tax=Pseudanabaena sp. lw0831 TaxID=1357935 RepID=UPI001A1E35BD|nr:DUF4157 domain-containing protein [Pseudanabaena sp. lw0831]GBO53442.1 hypothetical protein APA_1349 [Pseudanabaena sp. lw0831]
MEAVKNKTVNRAAIVQKPAASVKQVQRQVVTNRSSVQVQTSTKVSSPNDAAEKEADTTSKKIMRMAMPESSIAYVKTDSGGLFRQVKQEEKEKKVQTKLRSPYIMRFANSGIFTQRKPEEAIHRKAAGENTIAPSVSADIQNSMSSGSPLPMGVRRFMEPRFRADFSKVKIHTGDKAAKLNKQVNAQAFAMGNHVFFGKNKFQPDSHEGKELIAHELTHTIQQGEVVQRSEDIAIAQQSPPQIQRLGLSDALDYFADKANLIPGFRMFTIVLGVNPINMNSVDRSAANIMRAIVEFIPGGGFITQALDNHGVFEKVGNWVEQQIKTLGMVGSAIKQAVTQFLDSLGWRDIFDLGGVWNRAKSIFTDPINRIISFAKGLITGILKFVKDAILKPLAALAQNTRGYDLLKAILGEDPVTGEAVPRNADTLIGGFMKLIGQEEVWENIKKGKAIERAWAWFQGALAGLMGLVRAVPAKIISTITSLSIQDIVTVAGAFTKIVSAFANIAIDFISWGIKQVISLLEILFSVVAPGVMPYIKKAQAAFMTIIKNPIAFVGNLVKAGKQGFQMFASNILEHLKAALIKWITGPLGEAGVYIPQSFSLIEIVKLVLSVLGLTWQNIRSKLVKIIPEPVLVGLEKTAGILVTLVKDGPAAAWEQIKSELSELKDQMIAQVTQMISTEVVKAAITKLVSMLNPAGAVIQAIIATYNTVTFFIEKINQIAAVVAAFIDSISAIANGQVGNAAKKVETTMANTLTIVIAFLAKFAGLGNIPDKVVGIVKKIRAPIDKGLDKIVAWLGKMLEKAKQLFSKKDKDGKPDERTEAQKAEDLKKAVAEAKALEKKQKKPSSLNKALDKIKSLYRLTDLSVKSGEKGLDVHAAINPEITFQIDPDVDDELAKKIGIKAAPKINALPGSTKVNDVKNALNQALEEACSELKIDKRGKNLVYEGGATGAGMPIEEVYVFNSGEKTKIGAIWNSSQLYESVSNPVGGLATTFKNRVTKELFVHDAKRQYVQRYIIRNLSDDDLKNMRAKPEDVGPSRGPIQPTGPKQTRPILEHVMGAKPSPYISATKTPRGQITNEKGESFESGGQAKIDLCWIKSNNIFDLSTRVGQDEWGLSSPTSPKAEQALKDVIRTQEVLIKGTIPKQALIKIK